MDKRKYITASEIGEYVYCKRAWWLRLGGEYQPTPAMVRGNAYHNALSYKLVLSTKLKIIALLLIGIALLTVILIVSSIFGS